jgi:hypothetical protein
MKQTPRAYERSDEEHRYVLPETSRGKGSLRPSLDSVTPPDR